MVVRCTAKTLKLLGRRPSAIPVVDPTADDWYANLLWFDRRKCLLVTHASTVFSVLLPDVRKADLAPIGPALVEAITLALDAERLRRDALGALDPSDVTITTTASRRVLGFMNDVTRHISHVVYSDYASVLDIDVISLNRGLQRTLHNHGGRYATPLDLVAERTGA